MKRWRFRPETTEKGLVLPAVLAMLVLGALLMLPFLSFVMTGVKSGELVEKDVKGLYAADAGVEDALWRLRNDKPTVFPFTYQMGDVNGMAVDVTINMVSEVSGESVAGPGVHADWLWIWRSVSYNGGVYYYTLYLQNRTNSNIKLEKMLINFPPDLTYANDSTGGDITNVNPVQSGDPDTGITLVWEFGTPSPTIESGPDPDHGQFHTETHTFRLNGLPNIEGVAGNVIVVSNREDVGTVFELFPYSIIAQAKDGAGNLVSTIRAGVWEGGQLYISCYQVNP